MPGIRKEIKTGQKILALLWMTSNAINSVVLLHSMKRDLMQRFYQYDLRKHRMHFDSNRSIF